MPRGGSELEGIDVVGPDDGEPLVFVHGTIFNRTMWAPQRDALAGPFRVIAPDLPGHGSRDDEPFRLEAGIETVARTVDEFADDGVHLVGLSLGGYVATAFAGRHPERVESLVVSGASVNPAGLVGTLSRLTGKAALLASKSGLVERATDWLAERYVRGREIRPAQVEEIVDAGFDLRPFGEAGVEIANKDFRGAFAAFPGRALVLNGQFDLLMRLGEDDHADAGDAPVRVIERAGHACNLDRSEAYTDAVDGFVDARVEAGASD